MFAFTIIHRDLHSGARTGIFETPHGNLKTPDLAIVATEAAFKTIPSNDIPHTGIQYAISNTFHIWVKNIIKDVEKAGGIHNYMNYTNTIATDSGGFQVFSLGFGKTHGTNKLGAIFPAAQIQSAKAHGVTDLPDISSLTESDTGNPLTITEDGVTFTFDGKEWFLTPEISMDLQHRIGADIIFAFDECTSSLNTKEYTAQSLDLTHRWLDRCITAHKPFAEKQALFAIVQGGAWRDLREKAARHLAEQDVPGFGVGGSLGKTKEDMHQILEWTLPLLPDAKPRHLLGIGNVRDIFEGVERGIDLFDCVIPTREARHRMVYTPEGRKTVRISRVTDTLIDPRPGSPCAEEGITWLTLAKMFQVHDPKAPYYATRQNIFFFTTLMKDIRKSIENGTFADLKNQYLSFY